MELAEVGELHECLADGRARPPEKIQRHEISLMPVYLDCIASGNPARVLPLPSAPHSIPAFLSGGENK